MPFELVPIPGMEYTQKNFVYLKNHGKNVAFNSENKPFLTLHERFQLLERGYRLKYHEDSNEQELERSVKLSI